MKLKLAKTMIPEKKKSKDRKRKGCEKVGKERVRNKGLKEKGLLDICLHETGEEVRVIKIRVSG